VDNLKLSFEREVREINGIVDGFVFIRGTVASFRALISALSLKIKQGEGIQSDITMVGHGDPIRIELIGEPAQQPESGADIALQRSEASKKALWEALLTLRIDCNRLCDRNLGGTYEDDARKSIREADAVLAREKP
jgi:hypothetical protein